MGQLRALARTRPSGNWRLELVPLIRLPGGARADCQYGNPPRTKLVRATPAHCGTDEPSGQRADCSAAWQLRLRSVRCRTPASTARLKLHSVHRHGAPPFGMRHLLRLVVTA